MDDGNHEEEDRRPGATLGALQFDSQSSLSRQPRYHHQLPHPHPRLDDSDFPSTFDEDDDAAYGYGYEPDHTSPSRQRLSPVAYAANNLQAVTANAHATREHTVGLGDPDDFYRSFRPSDLVSSPQGYVDDAAMATSSLPIPRQPQNTSLRSNGTLTNAKYPSSSTTRPGARPSVRSVSAPLDEKPPRSRPAGAASNFAGGKKPSVKDLKKRFDQQAAQASSSSNAHSTTTVRRTAPRIPTREGVSPSPSAANYRAPGSITGSGNGSAGQNSYTSARLTPTREAGSGARPSQRSRAVAEDLTSNNSQSFASRIQKPQSPVAAQSHASKSMTNLSPMADASDLPLAPLPAQSRGLLFGEILPSEDGSQTAGYGIPGTRPRRTSESNLLSPYAGAHHRTLSHPEVEPTSPTDWYRGANGLPETQDKSEPVKPSKLSKIPAHHNRVQSDHAGAKPNGSRSKTPQLTRQQEQTEPASPSNAASRLPVSVRKTHSPSSSSSPPSSRANSPSTLRRPPSSQAKSRNASVARAKTPTNSSGLKRANHPGAITPNNNTRLNVYVSAPPPKLSPPLRSSRPRQPVSTATTASSRMKVVERGTSPAKQNVRGESSKPNEAAVRRRKISMGPIDFESRREQIKLSYSKSIRETEAKAAAAKKRAEEKEKKRREAEEQARAEREAAEAEAAAARAVEEAEAEAHAAAAAATGASPELDQTVLTEHEQPVTDDRTHHGAPEIERAETALPQLAITTAFPSHAQPTMISGDGAISLDSPTLGIPGSFPNLGSPDMQDEAPRSAISNTTEFDDEPQEQTLSEIPIRADVGMFRHDAQQLPSHPKLEYRSPFEELPDDDDMSIKVSLETSPHPHRTSTINSPLHTEIAHHPDIPGSYKEDEYEPQPVVPSSQGTTVTILGRNADFSSPPRDGRTSIEKFPDYSAAVPRPRVEKHQRTWPEPSQHNGFERTAVSGDEYSDPDAGLSKLEQFYVGPNLGQAVSGLRDSIIESSEGEDQRFNPADAVMEAPRFSVDTRRTVETAQSRNLPRTSNSVHRTSQATVWTEYSMNSQDEYSDIARKHRLAHRRDDFERRADSSFSESGSRPPSPSHRYDKDLHDFRSSRDISPHVSHRLPFSEHRLPELDTGGGFVVEYSHKNNAAVSSIPVLPDHSPPPIPNDGTFADSLGSAPASEYYDDTRPSSYLQSGKDDQSSISISMDTSHRESEDLGQVVSSAHSLDQTSFDNSEEAMPGTLRLDSQQTLVDSELQDLPPKERKRLFTRLETIKELIDTEQFFIRDMNIVEEIYKGTAEACPKLDDQTIKLIFRNTDQIITFHTDFLAELKEGVSSVYAPKTQRSHASKDGSTLSEVSTIASSAPAQLSDSKDRETSLGPIFIRHMDKMKTVHEAFLKNSDHAAKRLIQIQEDPTVKVWLNECNDVAQDLTKAWNLDSLLIKPMQRITKYPNLIIQLLHETPPDHPDRPGLETAKAALENAIEDINKTKKNFELVGQIVGRKRKESDVRAGFARAFGKRVDKLQATTNRPAEDSDYQKLHEKFGDDYLRLQVVLRDVEFYTRQVTTYVHEFLQYLSAMELVMRLQPSPHPELESKWVRFNVSMRDIEKVALEQHLSAVRKHVIEPFELVIKAYSNPSLAMKKRAKRRLDYEKSVQLKKGGKKIDKALTELVEHYDALNEALKKELPKLSNLTEKVGNICLANFVSIQAQWYAIWKEKVKVVLEDPEAPELSDIVAKFQRDFKFQDEQINTIAIVNPASKGRPSQSASTDESHMRPRPSPLSPRERGQSLNDTIPSLPTPDFLRRHSGQFTVSPSSANLPSPHQYYSRDYYPGASMQSAGGSAPPLTPEMSTGSSRSLAANPARPGTGQSYDSNAIQRQSMDSNMQSRRYSSSNQTMSYQTIDEPSQRFSGLFHSALPPTEGPERGSKASQASSRASSRERRPAHGYNVLWLAASLFEFNIQTTKHEAGYPYLTYQAGEIFDVIAEKGELWLAKNQDDPNNVVGWLWSKHFAKLADD